MTTQVLLPKPLPSIFTLDAALAAGMGFLLVGFAEPLHAVSGGGLEPDVLRWIGLGLWPWALHNWLVGRERRPSAIGFSIQALGDSLWILGSVVLALLHFETWTVVGKLLYVPQIALVVFVLVAKVRAFRDSR